MRRAAQSLGLWLVVASALAPGRARGASPDEVVEFNAYLLPTHAFGAPGEMITVSFEVDSSARRFNGYDLTLRFDPEILQFESVEEGALMVDACATRFTNLETTDSTLTYSHVLLCSDVSVNGPGTLSTYRFLALETGTSPVEAISDPDRTFFDDGLFVWPGHPDFPRQVVLHDMSVVVIDPTSDATDLPGEPERQLEVSVLPNPFHDNGRIVLRGSGSVGRILIRVLDLRGRCVGTWRADSHTTDAISIPWRLFESTGQPLSTGIYFLQVAAAGGCATHRITLIK